MRQSDVAPIAEVFAGRDHLRRLFEPEARACRGQRDTAAQGRLSLILSGDRREQRLSLNHLDKCLELAYRKGIVDANLEARLKGSDVEQFESTLNELRVGRFIEGLGNTIDFYPLGRAGKSLDFRASGRQSTCSVEVKTIFPSEQERAENEVAHKLWMSASSTNVGAHFEIGFHSYATKKEFKKTEFQRWLKQSLSQMIEDKRDSASLLYRDGRTGFSVTVEARRLFPRAVTGPIAVEPLVTSIGESEDQGWPGRRIGKKIRNAIAQLPKREAPCLVTINRLDSYPLFDDEFQALLYGAAHVSSDLPIPPDTGAVFSNKQNTRLSAVGVYTIGIHKGMIEEELEIYYNPYTQDPVDPAMFGSRTVRHFAVSPTTSLLTSL